MNNLSQDHKDLGVVYTPAVLVEFICKATIQTFLLDQVNRKLKTKDLLVRNNFAMEDLPSAAYGVILDLLEKIRIFDPAVGSGNFLQASFEVLLNLHKSLINLGLQKKSLNQIRLDLVTRNLFGVDISEKAVESCRRNLISLVSKLNSSIVKENLISKLKLHIKKGNSLIGNPFGGEIYPDSESLVLFNWDVEFPSVALNGGFTVCVGNPPWNILKPLEKEFFSKYDPNLSKYSHDKQEANTIISNLKTDGRIYEDWIRYESTIKEQSEYYRKTYQYQSGLIQVGRNVRRVSGDINLYKLFLERIFFLLKENGVCGIIIPSGIHSDAGTKGLRQLLFEENEVSLLYSFENRQGIFPAIHKSFKFDILIFRKNQQKTTKFQTVFMLKDPEFLNKRQDEALTISWEKIKRYSPIAWSIIEFKNKLDIKIVEKMYRYPVLAESITGFSKIVFSREFDVSIDNHLFNADGKGFPVYEGKMIEQFTHQNKEPRYWIKEPNLEEKFNKQYSEHKRVRIGFRAIAASTNRRTMIAALIPANSCCCNSIIYIKNFDKSNRLQMMLDDLLYLLGIFNSFIFDYMLRLKVSQNINMFILRDMPLPRIKNNVNFREIITLVKAIYSEVPEIKSEIKLGERNYFDLSYSKKRAILDARVAILYNLTFKELEYILDQFHIRDKKKESELNKQKGKILSVFKRIRH